MPAVWGVEPQRYAIERARRADPTLTIVPGTAFALPFRDGCFDLAFTSGVLIHISPDDLGRAIDELYRVTSRWLIVIEYDHRLGQQTAEKYERVLQAVADAKPPMCDGCSAKERKNCPARFVCASEMAA